MTAVAVHRLEEPAAPGEARTRRPGRWLLGLAVGMIMASGGLWLLDPVDGAPMFPLRQVTLEGRLQHVTEADLRRAMQPYLEGGLLSLDVVGIRTAVESLPWVKRASVRRLWPQRLAIDIEEQRPLARWGEMALVNAEGSVFRPAAVPEGLPRLAGPEARRGEVVRLYRSMRGPLEAHGLSIAGLRLDARGAWTLRLEGGVLVELGTHELEARLARFLGALSRLRRQSGRSLGRVDLRYPNGFAIEWRSTEDVRKGNGNGKAQ